MMPWFEETQRLRDNSWIVVIFLALFIGPLGLLYYGVYQQFGLGDPWGDQPMSDPGLLGFTFFMTLCSALAAFMVLNLQLETRIDREGIHYRMKPIIRSWRLITPGEIAAFEMKDRFKPMEGGGLGRHRNLLRKTTSYKMYSGKHLEIKRKNGQRLLLGTRNKEGMAMAMRKLMDKNEMI